jgi:hypothetical protein
MNVDVFEIHPNVHGFLVIKKYSYLCILLF